MEPCVVHIQLKFAMLKSDCLRSIYKDYNGILCKNMVDFDIEIKSLIGNVLFFYLAHVTLKK